MASYQLIGICFLFYILSGSITSQVPLSDRNDNTQLLDLPKDWEQNMKSFDDVIKLSDFPKEESEIIDNTKCNINYNNNHASKTCIKLSHNPTDKIRPNLKVKFETFAISIRKKYNPRFGILRMPLIREKRNIFERINDAVKNAGKGSKQVIKNVAEKVKENIKGIKNEIHHHRF